MTDDANADETPRVIIDPKAGNEEFAKAARERGWAAAVPFDYAAYAAQAGDDTEWAGAAMKYEWKDEYGDIAPRVPQLESMLYNSEDLPDRGLNFEALEAFEASVEGPKQLNPIREVNASLTCLDSITDTAAVHRGWSSPSHA